MKLYPRGPSGLQKISMSLMAVLVLLTFVGSNLHALLWQSSEWLVSTVLPAVVVDLTNDERAHSSVSPLVRNTTLDEAARLKAEDMATREYFAHYSPDGVSPWHWFEEVGYVYAHAGENLAIHFTDSAEVVEAWMNSPAHRENIVGAQYREIGVGTAKGTYEGYETVYVVQLFGTPAVPPAPAPTPPQAPVVETVVTEVPAPASPAPEPAPTPEPVLVAETLPEAVPELPESIPVPLETAVEETLVLPEQVLASTNDTELDSEVVATTPEPIVSAESESETVSEPPLVQAPVLETAPGLESEEASVVALADANVVIIESALIATSSGLAVAQVTTPNYSHAGATIPSIMTQPHAALQFVYLTLGSLVVLLLAASIVLEARRFRLTQVVYGVMLLVGMGALWYAHAFLTSGAVVV